MNHFKPHPGSAFEGYYSKFRLPSGASVALIVCSVFNATTRPPHMVSFTYVPPQSADRPTFQREVWVKDIEYTVTGSNSFMIKVANVGSVKIKGDEVTYDITAEDFTFRAKTSTRTPWTPTDANSTPAGLLAYAPLPIQWHVHSLHSECEFELDMTPGSPQLDLDRKGFGHVHIEKNWAQSFPKSYIWIQGLSSDSSRGVCVAGGNALGPLEAYLIGYRDGRETYQFAPPFSLSLFGFSPFLSTKRSFADGFLSLEAQSFTRKMAITCRADPGGFFTLSAPLPEGHRPKFCAQSFEAEVRVEVYESFWGLGPWRLVREDSFEHASLEFGGEYFTKAGESRKE